VTLSEGERLVWFPGEPPEVIPARQGQRRKLTDVQAIELKDQASVTFAVTGPLMALAKVRLVQDGPEELPLPAVVGPPQAALRH